MSQPPEYPGSPEYPGAPAGQPAGGPGGYPPPPNYGSPPPGYGAPGYGAQPTPPGYGPQGGQPPGGPAPRHAAPPGYGAPPTPPPPSSPPPGYGPPGGGYPAPQAGYGGPQGGPPGAPTAAQFSIGDALSWSWNKFTQNLAALLVPAIVYLAGMGILGGATWGVALALSDNTTSTYTDAYGQTYTVASAQMGPAAFAVITVGYLAVFALALYMQAGMVSGCLDVADGKPVTIGTFFKPRNLVPVLLTILLVVAGVMVGSILCFIPGLVFAFFAMFAFQFAIDRSLSPVESVKASIAVVRPNLVNVLLSALAQSAVVAVGQVACGVGVFAAIPVALLIQTYTYRKLSGGQVAAVEQPANQAGAPPGYQPGYQQGPPPGSYPA
jgi:uncharacterized membrane protein